MKSRVKLVKLGQVHDDDERDNHSGDVDSAPACRLVAFRPANVSVVMKGFLLRKPRGPENIFFPVGTFVIGYCDWVYYCDLFCGPDAMLGTPAQKTTFLIFCSHPTDM